MNWIKKLSIRIFIILYALSYFLQNSFFIDWKKVYAAETPSTTNIVAIFVDKNIYPDIKANLVRYTTKYLQKKIANSKAVVLPIDTTTLKAHEISQILENMYFEGLKDEGSKLVGTVLIWNIPLPVVENNGFIYPSIYPYVDFEDQQFIYDTTKKFFVYNNNPNGQAELRHGIIQFKTASEYNDFFIKVRAYYTNPTKFIDKAIRYEDFIGLKKYFIPENTKYYINSMMFSEDIGYHRFNNLMLNILKDEHNESALSLGTDLKDNLQDVEDPELKAYADDMESRNNEAAGLSEQITSSMPTLTLKTATQEMLKGYDGLVSPQFLAKIKDNIWGLARRYKTTNGETFTDYSSITDKIAQKDNRVLGDIDNDVQPLLIQMNDFMEGKLNEKIDQEKYYLTIPIPVSELDFEGDIKIPATFLATRLPPRPSCIRKKYDYYQNYYFGINANQITSAQDTSAYRWTFQNLSSISGQTINDPLQSIGWSFNIFSTQVEANRWYNINNTKDELVLYDILKTNKQELWNKDCNLELFGYCIRWKKTRKPQDSDDADKCYINDEEKQWWCESLTGFSQRYRGWASPMNLNAAQQLTNYNYKDAKFPIYDIAGSKKINTQQANANSYSWAETYASIMQERFAVKERQEDKYDNIDDFIDNPKANGIDLKFTNQIPTNDNLDEPIRSYNTPKTYAQNDFFTIYTPPLLSHKIKNGKIVLYDRDDNTNIIDVFWCTVKWHYYTYKTIDSRVKNISPTRKQISSTEAYKFKEDSPLEIFYNNVKTDLFLTKNSVVNQINEFNGTNTGVASHLTKVKNLIASGNNGIHMILTFLPTNLIGMGSTWVTNLANSRSQENLNTTKILEITWHIEKINEGLDDVLNYMNNININNTLWYFSNIIETERFKKQNVEILDTWKTDITQNLDQIKTNINIFKSTFANARGIYNNVPDLNNNAATITALQAQRGIINALDPSCLPNLCWCDANHYKAVCDVLDNLITILQEDFEFITGSIINDKINKIQEYPGENFGTIKPFIAINTLFTNPDIFEEITGVKTIMNSFDVSTNPDKKETNKGMNLTTSDRPIDNIRNITFKGIGWDLVQLNYPNLYEVNVYKESDSKLILKSPDKIKDAIIEYLKKKAIDYNALLNTQRQKRNAYYTTRNVQFSLLETYDTLANPLNHTYSNNSIPEDYFIDQLEVFLDTLENAPEYGKKAIYGMSKSDTRDEKLDMVAKLLYYQNITWPERLEQTSVVDDMAEIKESFDINLKIQNVVQTYLTEGNDQGKFITPTYNSTGYEIGYINSDGEDYVSSKPTPAFVQQIQTAQEKAKVKNKFVEASTSELQKEIDSCEWVDTDGSSLLFDFKTFSSPWAKAMKCRAQKILEKPFKFEISFKNAQWPVFAGVFKEIWSSFENRKSEWEEYGNERWGVNNEETIKNVEGKTKEILQRYNNYATVNIDKTIIGVNDTGNAQITIGMMKDLGDVEVKISWIGDNCFKVQRGAKTRGDICTAPAKEYFNPNKENYIFEIALNGNKAGSTALKIEFCPHIGWITNLPCITKQQVINILPWPVATMQVETPTDIVMEGAELPIAVNAADIYQNSIGQSIQGYTISVNSGDGKIYDGAASNENIKFDKFPAWFIYQAPIWLENNKKVSLIIFPDKTITRLWANEAESKSNTVQKIIEVAKGKVTVMQNNIVLYQTNTPQSRPPKITFNLPKDEASIQYMDSDGTAQIIPANIPSITIDIKDLNNAATSLTTVASITSTQWLLKIWTIEPNIIQTATGTKTQFVFRSSNNFIISWTKSITLYPSFKAGNDTITINIPGMDPIIIPVTVNPWLAKTVLMKLEKSRLDLTTTTISKWTIHVVDTRNNKVTSGTKIKLWVIGSATGSTNEFMYSGKEYTYTITAKKPGGEGYVFAYIDGRPLADQMPAYERFIIQESILPQSGLNVMYLNLFGTDRGNQRGYFSENNQVINTITTQSNKLLATTTQLVDPTKIKQIEYIINPNGQIQNISNKEYTLTIDSGAITAQMPEIVDIHLGASENFTIEKLSDSWAAITFGKNENKILYIPEPTDSVITSNEVSNKKITINGADVFDLSKWTIDPSITIIADNETLADMNTYTITYNAKTIGKLMLRSMDNITANTANVDVLDPITYGQTTIFSEWSTNTQGIGIYIQTSAFTKQGYASIEDSADAMLGIWFTNDFKNVANFANGKSVGEATLPYGSQFLINFWDPLAQRREKNPNIPDTDFDASIGQTIYADPNKTIFKTLPIDFNTDGLQDIIVVYTDGVVKILKNYWGTTPYKNLQELMIIAEPIKDIKIGDVDGNGDDDIFIITTNNKGVVYLNTDGIFPVDGKNICLNVNSEPDMINPTPDDFSNIKQIFVEDMDKDNKLDIVTNDAFGDIKIFYGWSNNNGANYISSVTWTCDANRYTRQKNTYKTINRYGARVNSSRYIQDNSLIHRKGMEMPTEGKEEEKDVESPDNTAGMSEPQMQALKIESMNKIKDMVANNDSLIASGASQLAYTDNPLTKSPSYELLPPEEISYLPINESNAVVSVYKEYQDMNGWILKKGDEVVIKTTIISKKNNNKLTYIDQLKWPRELPADTETKEIKSLVFITGNTWWIRIDWNTPEGYQFVMDNIQMSSWAMLSFSYKVIYKETSVIKIDVKDENILKENRYKDGYPDIITNIADSCQKNRRIFFNKKVGDKRTYEKVYDDIQKEMNDYTSWAKVKQVTAINWLLDQLANADSLDSVSNLPGMDNLENRSAKNIISSILQPGWLSLNINSNFIDSATAEVSKKLDTALQWLCQWFKLWEWWTAGCSWVPVPFNQAFLAPGDYHVFWCVPKATSPLYPIFETINSSLGKGMPLLNIPGNYPIPPAFVTYAPLPGLFGFPFKWATDGFFLWVLWWTYSSQFRLYIVPTLTMGLGMAMCFGPYTLGKALPKPLRDIAGNCIVFALPPMTSCDEGTTDNITESIAPPLVDAAGQWICNTPPKLGNTIVFAEDNNNGNNNNEQTLVTTANFPFQIVAAGSSENNPPYSAAIPQGNFGWLIVIDQDPTIIPAVAEEWENYEWYELKKWEKISLKIVGAKTKGLVQCVVQDWTTRQIQYIENNLTKMTIQLDLPNITTLFQGFDKIGNLQKTYESLQKQDQADGYIQWGTSVDTNIQNETGSTNRTQYISKQQLDNISESVGENPFEAIQKIFEEVPLINIDSKTINLKIPALTSEDINTYVSYLKLRVEKADNTLKERDEFFASILPMCKVKEIKEQTGQSSKFLSFRENSAGIINSVKQNIIVLEKYKKFPTQLYQWTHLTDRYLTEVSALLSDTIGTLTQRLDINATRFSQHVDAIILIKWAIKTWQAIIDFSVNRSEKCSTCSNDNYGSFSCSLSFLCPKLPIFPIPAFKIPNIYMDMSHIELGMNITLPKINFVPIKIPLPQLPDLPEPPTIEVDWDIMYGLNINFFESMSLPTIPVIPEPPTLPEPPSFIPSINMQLPVLPPAPKIPKILPEINAILKVAEFIGKVFCIVKWGIGLVGEKWVKGKVEQLTQRTWNVPVFDYFNLTTKFKDPPLQWYDYKLDAYATLKFNFDGVYDVFNNIAQITNGFVSEKIETPIQKGVDRVTDKAKNNAITDTGFDFIEGLDQNINFNGYMKPEEEATGTMEYTTAYNELRQWLLQFKNSTLEDKTMNNRVKTILATVENKSTVLPATNQIEQVEKAAKEIINQKIKENQTVQKEIQNYDTFIEKLKKNQVVLVNDTTVTANLKTPILTIDSATETMLQSQENPTKTYLDLNKKMVQGYLDAVNNDGPEKLNMSTTTYKQSKKYLETTKEKIDTALLAYNDGPLLAQGTCTNCSSTEGNNYSTDISAYVNGVYIESYSGDADSSGSTKLMVNTMTSTEQIAKVKTTYTTDLDLNNDELSDILMYDSNTIYIKYAQQESEHFSEGNNSLTTYYTSSNNFYSYANEHPWTWLNGQQRYIKSLDQLRDVADAYGYIEINDITIKVVENNKEVKNFKTEWQTFDTLQLSRKNSTSLGEQADGYIIKVSKNVDNKDNWGNSRFQNLLWIEKKQKYILVLPQDTDYKKWLLTIDESFEKNPINLELGDSILAVEYYDPGEENISLTFKELPREWLYINIAALTIRQDELTNSQKKSFTLYKKTSPRSNQTVAGMQNIWDVSAPVGDIVLRRNKTSQVVSTGVVHEWYVNTSYTLKSTRKDDVVVKKMIIQQEGITLLETGNDTQIGTLDLGWLFFTWTTQQSFDFIAIDQNNNITKETVSLNIKIPDIEVIDMKKSWETTADIIAKISNDMDEWLVIFQRLRNGIRKDIQGTNQNGSGGFSLVPNQTVITGWIFTIGNDIWLYDNQNNEIATIDPDSGEIKINQWYENKITINLNFATHIPVIELRDIVKKNTLFQIVLPIESITKIQMNTYSYEQLQLPDGGFGDFNNGYCIKNNKNDCILYTNNIGAIYVPGIYASSLAGTYQFDKTNKNTTFIIKDQSNKNIVTLTLKIKATK